MSQSGPHSVERSLDTITDVLISIGEQAPTLRDQFMMAALTGMLSYCGDGANGSWHNNATPDDVATKALAYADACMKVREVKS